MKKNAFDSHTDFMRQALELARCGLGSVEPNPAVGCVIVRDEPLSVRAGMSGSAVPHAEVNALSDCENMGIHPTAQRCMSRWNLCTHRQNAPLFAGGHQSGYQKGRHCRRRSDPLAGGGIRQLREAGIEVETGLCRDEAETLNAPFFKHARTGLPWSFSNGRRA